MKQPQLKANPFPSFIRIRMIYWRIVELEARQTRRFWYFVGGALGMYAGWDLNNYLT